MKQRCCVRVFLAIALILDDAAVVQGFHIGPKRSSSKSFASVKKKNGMTRRSLLGACLWLPAVASAAPPITMKELESPGVRMERTLFRKKPAQALRPKIDLEFAVLLMKSSYDALDALDCVAMDQFQRDFFLLRSTEYEYYISQLGPGVIYQGPNKDNPDIMCPCVSDPYYFDFLSFAQYAIISREIQNNPPVVFEERDSDGVNLTPRIVRRNPEFTNDKLSGLHEQMVGKAIVDRLEETFAGTEASVSTSTLGESMKQLVKLFLVNGYAWDGTVSETRLNESYTISLQSPATLWSSQALQVRGATPNNCFILKAAKELAQRSGYRMISSTIRYENLNEIVDFSVVHL